MERSWWNAAGDESQHCDAVVEQVLSLREVSVNHTTVVY